MAQTFIGARISLTSISDIRYRGTLHGIDHVASTIQLSNVYSMGTENRRPANEYIPPNETPYEFIIFRATEVKDLAVDQPPPQQNVTAQRSVHDDPAVIGASSHPAQGYNNYGAMPPQSVNPYQTPQPVAAAPPQQPAVQEPAPVAATNGKQRASESSSAAVSPVAPASVNGAISTPAAPLPATAASTSTRANRPKDNRRADSSPVRSASASLEKVERAIGDLRLSNANANAGAHNTQPHHGGRHNRRGNNPRSGGGANARAGGATVVPDADFDFARSNAKFDKVASAGAGGGTGAPATDSGSGASSPEQPKSPGGPEKTQFYDRTRSFFDDISSDSKAKTQGGGGPGQGPGGRNRREEERSKNMSTFGEVGGTGVYWPSTARDGGSGWRGGRRRKWNGGGGGRQQHQQPQATAQQ